MYLNFTNNYQLGIRDGLAFIKDGVIHTLYFTTDAL